jgi:hypothetical protein
MGTIAMCENKINIRFSVKKDEVNSEEQIKEFLNENKLKFLKDIKPKPEIITDFIKKGYIVNIYFNKGDEEWSSEDYKENIEDFLEVLEEYHKKELYTATVCDVNDISHLKHVDFELVKKYEVEEIDKSYMHSVNIMETYLDVYKDDTYLERESIKIKKCMELLKLPKSKLELITKIES